MTVEVPYQLDLEHHRCFVGSEPMIFHCHHYNTFLQRSILDAEYVDSKPVLVGAAEAVAYNQLTDVFRKQGLTDVDSRKRMAEAIYRWSGFGTFDLSGLSAEGGTVETPNSHYAMAWRVKFGPSAEPVCFFASGWLAGALAAIHDRPQGSYAVTHDTCHAVGGGNCVFKVQAGDANYTVFKAPGAGRLLSGHNLRPAHKSNVDYDGILNAVAGLPLSGDDQGNIDAFGVYLTRMYANYYNLISFAFTHLLKEQFGPEGAPEALDVAQSLFVEAGHVCAFFTLGGIMVSNEWNALIKPQLESPEDWVHGIVAVVNALGWGRWQVTQLSEREAEFVIHDDYESAGYLPLYGEAERNFAWLHEGGVRGIMNLVYLGSIMERPALTDDFYQKLFQREDTYQAECTAARAMGDEVTAFRVYRP